MGEGRNKLTRKIEYKANNSKGAVQETPSLKLNYTGIPLLCFTLWCFTDVAVVLFKKKKMKVCGHPASSKSISAIFPTSSDDDWHFLAIQYFWEKICPLFL